MNYIEQINLLNKIRRRDSLNTTAVALHVILLDICNRDDWENPFNAKNDRIMSDLDVTFKTFSAARNRLQQAGLIKFNTKNGSGQCVYRILTPQECEKARTSVKIPKDNDEVRDEVVAEVTNEVADKVGNKVATEVLQTHHGIILNKTKTKPKEREAERQPPAVSKNKIYDLNYFAELGHTWNIADPLLSKFNDYLIHRHHLGDPIKSPVTVTQLQDELHARGGNIYVASKMIEFTISRNARNLIFETAEQHYNKATDFASRFTEPKATCRPPLNLVTKEEFAFLDELRKDPRPIPQFTPFVKDENKTDGQV